MLPLQGVGVLVTRPAHQASALCRLLETNGATTVPLPALQILRASEHCELSARIGPIETFDLIVFSSANAVLFGVSLLARRHDLKLAAIGPATARALSDAGYPYAIVPADGFDSENLLKDPRLAVPGRRVLLVKGQGGRVALQQELARRGAQVIVADVYERVAAKHSAGDLALVASQMAGGLLQVVTATSAEIVANLLKMAPAPLRREFERMHWVVPSARVAAAGRALGLEAPLIQASSAEDRDLVAAIARWRSSLAPPTGPYSGA